MAVLLHIFGLLFYTTFATDCSLYSYPKVVGGSQGSTEFNQVDYHAASEQMVAVGFTKDKDMAGDTVAGYQRPFVVLYKPSTVGGTDMVLQWGKILVYMYLYDGRGVTVNANYVMAIISHNQIAIF